MSSQNEDPTQDHPTRRRIADEFLRAIFRAREGTDPEEFEKQFYFVRLLCAETFGKFGPINTVPELIEMLASLPTSFPVFGRSADDEAVSVGEMNLNWFEVWRTLEPLEQVVQQVMAESSCNREEAMNAAYTRRIAQIEWITLKMTIVMAEAFRLTLAETIWDAKDVWRASMALPGIPRDRIFKHLSQQFESSLRLRNPARPGRRAYPSARSWKEIEQAIKNHPSETPPHLGKFAAAMPRFKAKKEITNPVERRKNEVRAKTALKKELAKLHKEGFCPETNWRKLYTVVRSGILPRVPRKRRH